MIMAKYHDTVLEYSLQVVTWLYVVSTYTFKFADTSHEFVDKQNPYWIGIIVVLIIIGMYHPAVHIILTYSWVCLALYNSYAYIGFSLRNNNYRVHIIYTVTTCT